MKKIIKINFNEVLKKIFFNQDEKFFHALSFIIISLIAIHVSLYFNFYKFSSSWIENESKKITYIISPNENEKTIPLSISENIVNLITENSLIEKYRILDKQTIKDRLGLENLNEFSGIGMPLIFQIEFSGQNDLLVLPGLEAIVGDRIFEEYQHKDEIYEVSVIINRIKFFIFFMLVLVSILFAFLILTVTKATLVANLKFLEMLQIIGAKSFDMARSISYEVIKKIIPGAILSIIFVFIISTIIIKIFGSNLYFSDYSSVFDTNLKNFFLLISFLIIFLVLMLIYLTTYLFYFFEKRFFDKI